jgi:hypothetical protein
MRLQEAGAMCLQLCLHCLHCSVSRCVAFQWGVAAAKNTVHERVLVVFWRLWQP